LTILRLGPRRRATWIALGMLALPTAWSLAVGQAQIVVTLLTVLGGPWAIALGTNIKVFPVLLAAFWLGRRDGRSLALFAGWTVLLVAIQFVLAPQATIDFARTFGLSQVGNVENRSLYVASPLLWAGAVAAGIVIVLRLAPSRWGNAAAVALSVFATPRLLIYQLSTLVAAVREPSDPASRSRRARSGRRPNGRPRPGRRRLAGARLAGWTMFTASPRPPASTSSSCSRRDAT
jgi:hypothetical protein